MMTDSRRVQRVGREIRQVVSELLVRGLKRPLPGFCSVAGVDVNPDLRSARVFIKVAGTDQDRQQAEVALNEDRSWIQRSIASQLQMKFCPVIRIIVGGPINQEESEIDQMIAQLNQPKTWN